MVSASVSQETGGIRCDITQAAHVVAGEDRTMSWEVQDEECEPVASLAGYEFTFCWVNDVDKVNCSDLDFVADGSQILFTVEVTGQTAPNVDVPWTREQTRDMKVRTYGYELWRTDTGNVYRIAYGTLKVIG